MELSIDKSRTAFVAIDLQKGIVSMSRSLAPHSAEEVVSNASKIAEAFRRNEMPVFLVHVQRSREATLNPEADVKMQFGNPPADWSEIVPRLGPKPSDVVITKQQWGAFYGTDLDLQLRRRKMDVIILCGVSTNIGVESTARFAYEYGYQQIFAEDAMSASSAEEHGLAINTVFKRMGRVRSTSEILKALE